MANQVGSVMWSTDCQGGLCLRAIIRDYGRTMPMARIHNKFCCLTEPKMLAASRGLHCSAVVRTSTSQTVRQSEYHRSLAYLGAQHAPIPIEPSPCSQGPLVLLSSCHLTLAESITLRKQKGDRACACLIHDDILPVSLISCPNNVWAEAIASLEGS